MRGKPIVRLAGAAIIMAALLPSSAKASHGPPELVEGSAPYALVSPDGTSHYFLSSEPLVPEDTDETADIYRRTGGTLRLLSTGPTGGNGPFPVIGPVVPDFGQGAFFFTEEALVPEDTDGGMTDIYQREQGTTRLITAGTAQAPAPASFFFELQVSADGSQAFFNTPEALVPEDTDAQWDIYRRAGGTTTLVTPNTPLETRMPDGRFTRSVSRDGDVIFLSRAQHVPEDTDAVLDVYKWTDGIFELVSQGPAGGNANMHVNSFILAMTPDGSHAYFATHEQLVAQDGDGETDIYERANGTTRLISTSADDSVPAGFGLSFEAVSEDGSRVIFSARGPGFTTDDLDPGSEDVYQHFGGATTLLSTAPGAVCQNSPCHTGFAEANADATHVVFNTRERLVAADVDGCEDLYERTGGTVRLITSPTECTFFGHSVRGISDDGSRIFFNSDESLVPQDGDACFHDWDEDGVYEQSGCTDAYEDQGGTRTLISTPAGSQSAGFDSTSRNGLAVSFSVEGSTAYVSRVAQPGYIRPKSATLMYLPLVTAFKPCTTPNREHGPPLAHASCSPPVPESPNLRVSVGESQLRSVGSLRVRVVAGVPGGADDTDVQLTFSLTNVMNASGFTEYAGELRPQVQVRRTDREGTARATTQDFPLSWSVPCAPTADPQIASTCAFDTTLDAIVPGAAPEGTRAIWALEQLQVFDGGPDGDADTTGDNTLFVRQGVFAP